MPDDPKNPPSFGTVLFVLPLPMLLIFMNTGLNTLATSGVLTEDATDQTWYQTLRMLGETPVALLITTLVAMYVLGNRRGVHKKHINTTMKGALPAVCSVILITGAGGMFGGVLRTSGIGASLTDVLGQYGCTPHRCCLYHLRYPTCCSGRRGRRIRESPTLCSGHHCRRWICDSLSL